ncbi:hypothetical protein EXIGLDRAFT_725644 [Exidia glandulosa HHB12029]|uniref:Uncharacterized protein n=1 Tax=Exidia glandulosa HHB12029 TaxID=1314781 RepID=A0A165Q709_EXIGL|nr:hypothetical protein EXIGLDRAFT_725644 [Exidia glandulosa HHB12029]
MRRWQLATALLAAPLACALLLYLAAPTLTSRLWPVAQNDRDAIDTAIRPPPREEREHGLWRARVPPVTQDELRNAYNAWYETTERLPESSTAHTDEEREAASRARAAALASWDWVPQINATLAQDWDWRTWAVRALRSTGGVIVVGDSIHLQLFHHLRSLLPPSFELKEDYARVYGFNDPNSMQPAYLDVFMHEDDPVAADLLAAAHVPKSRLTRPILSYTRDDLLMTVQDIARFRDDAVRLITDDGDPLTTKEDVDAAWKEFTGRFGEGFDTAKEGQDGVTNVVIGGWRSRVDKMLEPIGDWRGSEKTILVINTGAHWSGPCLPEIGEARLKRVYQSMVDTLAPQLAKLAAKTTILFRPTIPGHPKCDEATQPSSEADARAVIANMDFFQDMAWGTFEVFNVMWRDAFRALHANIGWLPVFTRSIMRPEYVLCFVHVHSGC